MAGVNSEREARIIRLRARGWTLRRIARDPRVRMTHQGVAAVLRRYERAAAAADADRGVVDRLALYRGAYVERDPAAIAAWERMKTRTAELMEAWAVQRHGRPLDDLDLFARQDLRAAAVEAATAEL